MGKVGTVGPGRCFRSDMPTLEFTTLLNASQDAVWKFHDSPEALRRITPPTTRVRLPSPMPTMAVGVRFTLVVSQPPIYLPLPWETIITEYDAPRGFVDTQGRGPFAVWRHEHRFEALSAEQTRLIDVVTYEPPFGPLGVLADRWFIRRQLTALFAYRHSVTKQLLEAV